MWAQFVYYNNIKCYKSVYFCINFWSVYLQQICLLRYDLAASKAKRKGKTRTHWNQIILLVWSGMVSWQWLDVSPRGNSWKAELQKNILGPYEAEKHNFCGGKREREKKDPQTSTEGHTVLTVAGQSSQTTYTTPGDNYSDWVSIAYVCSSLPVVTLESLGVCIGNALCECVCVLIRRSPQTSYCFAAQNVHSFDTSIKTKIMNPLKTHHTHGSFSCILKKRPLYLR